MNSVFCVYFLPEVCNNFYYMQEAKASKLVSIEQDLIVGIDQKLDKIINIFERIADQKEQKVVFRELSCSSPTQLSSRVKSASN